MIDFYKELQEHLEDEYKDVVVYAKLSDMANDPGEAQILRDIAREEHVHARHLKEILESAGKLVEPIENEEKAKAALE